MVSGWDLAFILSGLTLLMVGLVLWRLEARNPSLLKAFDSRTYHRWSLPTFMIIAAGLLIWSFILGPPWGSSNQNPAVLAVLGLVFLLVSWGWLRTHPVRQNSGAGARSSGEVQH